VIRQSALLTKTFLIEDLPTEGRFVNSPSFVIGC
jgi:hypothetical protein